MSENKKLSLKDEITDFLLYTSPNGDIKVEVLYYNENVWATQDKIAQLFGVQRPAVTKHLKNVFETGELDESMVSSILEHTTLHGAMEGKTQTNKVKFYNLDVIISVGYRVNSSQATQFRIWATKTLKEFLIKGFVMDDERLKNGQKFGKDYFQELLERVRSIRSSERRVWLKITDIFAELSTDYHEKGEDKQKQKEEFYSSIQNKFHYAITGQTAAEIVNTKSNHNQPNMGLMSWKNGPVGRILKSDVSIAKNYLSEKDVKALERSVSSFFDYVESLIERKKVFTMAEFAESVNKFLEFNEFKILDNKGTISADQAKKKAELEYDIFNITQKIDSDFEKFSKKVQSKAQETKDK